MSRQKYRIIYLSLLFFLSLSVDASDDFFENNHFRAKLAEASKIIWKDSVFYGACLQIYGSDDDSRKDYEQTFKTGYMRRKNARLIRDFLRFTVDQRNFLRYVDQIKSQVDLQACQKRLDFLKQTQEIPVVFNSEELTFIKAEVLAKRPTLFSVGVKNSDPKSLLTAAKQQSSLLSLPVIVMPQVLAAAPYNPRGGYRLPPNVHWTALDDVAIGHFEKRDLKAVRRILEKNKIAIKNFPLSNASHSGMENSNALFFDSYSNMQGALSRIFLCASDFFKHNNAALSVYIVSTITLHREKVCQLSAWVYAVNGIEIKNESNKR